MAATKKTETTDTNEIDQPYAEPVALVRLKPNLRCDSFGLRGRSIDRGQGRNAPAWYSVPVSDVASFKRQRLSDFPSETLCPFDVIEAPSLGAAVRAVDELDERYRRGEMLIDQSRERDGWRVGRFDPHDPAEYHTKLAGSPVTAIGGPNDPRREFA